MIQLGIAAFYHDSAACIVKDGKVIAAAEEERFTEIKHDAEFPSNAIEWLLINNNLTIDKIDEVCWYENPTIKKDRVEKIFKKHPFKTFLQKRKFKKEQRERNPERLLREKGFNGPIKYTDHHLSHAAFSFFTSPFNTAAILTIDGVGEWETVTISKGTDKSIQKILSIDFPNSLGMLYSAITAYLGFKPNEGEYKVMGLAPYGNPKGYYEKLEEVFYHTDNKFWIDQKYFTWEYSDKIMFNKNLCKLLELPPRLPEDILTQEHKNLAAALQKIYEKEFLRLVHKTKLLTGLDNLCLSGGCAYNGVANSLAYQYFNSVHIPFAPSDAGSAIGTCLYHYNGPRKDNTSPFLGPEFNDKIIHKVAQKYLDKVDVYHLSEKKLISTVASLITSRNIVAWFQGKMEFGARALGNRSILATSRDPKMRTKLNSVIKKREDFRPFAPSVLQEDANRWFYVEEDIPYMNQVVNAKSRLMPSATHVDGSCRVHTVTEKQNPKYYELLQEIKRIDKIGVVLNTSFNLKDQTITMSPKQAIERYINSDIDFLVINNFLIKKK